ncbi:MAG: tetratricopeptide repeat protein [Bernardetiaceae bacterium]|nr:tetratricopeptide repeat protein [Bernardetiaceae bacterium]
MLGCIHPAVWAQRFNAIAPADKPRLIDSLLTLLDRQTNDDTLQVQRTAQLSTYYLGIDYVKAVNYAQNSLTLAKKLGYARGQATSHLNLGLAFEEQGLPGQAIEHFRQGLAIFETLGDLRGQAISCNNLGNSYYSIKDYEKSLTCFQSSLKLKEKAGDQTGINLAYNNIGYNLVLLNRPAEAQPYLEKVLASRRAAKQTRQLAPPLFNLALCSLQQGDTLAAIALAQQSLAVAQQHQQWQRMEEASKGLAEMFAAHRQPDSAYHYSLLRSTARDTLAARNQQATLADLAAKYQVEELERRFVAYQEKQNWQWAWLAVVSTALAGGAAYFFVTSRRARRLNARLSAQNQQIEQQMAQLAQQKTQLAQQEEELRQKNQELTQLNRRLELTAEEQTQLAQTQQIQLNEYAHINAHNLRAPVSRIQGLVHLFTRETEADKRTEILTRLDGAVAELDQLTQAISELLLTKGQFTRDDLG